MQYKKSWAAVCLGFTICMNSNVFAQTNRNFADLINTYQEGKPDQAPWAGYWWPYSHDGIASPMSGESALTKYAKAKGEPPIAEQWEKEHHGKNVPKLQQWWGHSNGWSNASILFPEPRKPVKVNGVEFSISDIKALLTEIGMSTYSDYFGERVDVDDPNSPKYSDTVPGQYFLVLTNYMGKRKMGVALDRYTGAQVWAQPVAGYTFSYPKKEDYLGVDPNNPKIYKIRLTSTFWWVEDGVPPDVLTEPFVFEESSQYSSRKLKMELWLDGPVVFGPNGKILSSGNVIVKRVGESLVGGSWLEEDGYVVDGHPDFMWVPYAIIKPTDPQQDYINPHIDLNWVVNNLVKNGVPSLQVEASQPNPDKFPSVVYANGWSEISLQANYAKTTISTTGHFNITRNACGREAFGVLSLVDWNSLVESMNLIAQKGLGSTKSCVSIPEVYPYMDGTTDLKLSSSNSTIKLFELQGEKICTYISDQKLAENMLQLIHKLIPVFDKQDCPNGWGS